MVAGQKHAAAALTAILVWTLSAYCLVCALAIDNVEVCAEGLVD